MAGAIKRRCRGRLLLFGSARARSRGSCLATTTTTTAASPSRRLDSERVRTRRQPLVGAGSRRTSSHKSSFGRVISKPIRCALIKLDNVCVADVGSPNRKQINKPSTEPAANKSKQQHDDDDVIGRFW